VPWQISILLWFGFFIGQNLYQRNYSQSSLLPESVPPALSYLFGVAPLGIIVGLLLPHHISWSWFLVFLLILEGTLIGMFNWLAFKSIKRLKLSLNQTIYQIYEIIVIVLSWLVLGEKLNKQQIIGGVFIIASALLAIYSQTAKQNESSTVKKVSQSGILLCVAAAICLGIGLVTEKAALHYMSNGAYFIFGFGTQTIALLGLAVPALLKQQTVRNIKRHDIKRSTIMGLMSVMNGFFYIYTIQKSNNIALVTVIGAFILPLTVLAAYFVLHEKDDVKKLYVAVSLGVIGLVISAL
jgi:drug/metabolite transporter (DMT)-like permease